MVLERNCRIFSTFAIANEYYWYMYIGLKFVPKATNQDSGRTKRITLKHKLGIILITIHTGQPSCKP